MFKSALTFTATILLTTTIIAGGDDRDRGPVESLDAPITEKRVIGDRANDTTSLGAYNKPLNIPQEIESAAKKAYESCEDNFESDSVLVKYACIVAVGLLAI